MTTCVLLLPLALAFTETGTILIRESVLAVKTLDPGDVVRHRPLLGRERQATGMTKPVLPRLKLVVECNTLVEHEAFPPPAARGFGNLLEVAQNSAL